MNNYENNHHDGIAPVSPILNGSMEANLNNDNISDSQLNSVANKAMDIINTKEKNNNINFNILDSDNQNIDNSNKFNIQNSIKLQNTIGNKMINNEVEKQNYSKEDVITTQENSFFEGSNDYLDAGIISIIKYLKYIIIFSIPIINIILIINNLINKNNGNININNLAKAYLILSIISIMLFIIIKIF